MSGARILLVDDDPAILRSVRRALEGHDYAVRALEVGSGAIEATREFRPDVILLDLVLPDTDGIALCAELRPYSDAPIIVLSALGDDAKKVQALDAGADDYVTKPFSMDELLARVRVALRRQGNTPGDAALIAGPIRLDLGARQVAVDGQPVHLTPREFDLLRLLLQQQGRVLTQRFILSQVWGDGYSEDAHVLRTFVHQLRQKLATVSPTAAVMVVTDPGVGYRIDLPSP